jgi:hypothetical protein
MRGRGQRGAGDPGESQGEARRGVGIRECADRDVRRDEVGPGDSAARGGMLLGGFGRAWCDTTPNVPIAGT